MSTGKIYFIYPKYSKSYCLIEKFHSISVGGTNGSSIVGLTEAGVTLLHNGTSDSPISGRNLEALFTFSVI